MEDSSYIIPEIQISLYPKPESSSFSSSSSSSSSLKGLMLDPRILVDFGVKNLTLACTPCNSDNDNGGGLEFVINDGGDNEEEQVVKFPTMGLILHDNFCYKESIWMALTYLGVEERYLDQVVETLQLKVGQLFTDMSYCAAQPGFPVEFQVHASVLFYRFLGVRDRSTESVVGDEEGDEDVVGRAARDWPVEWLE